MKCKNCKNLNRKIEWLPVTYQYPWCYEINDSPDIEMERECSKYHGKTNGDRVRRMNDEELAVFLKQTVESMGDNLFLCGKTHYCYNCNDCYLNWLHKEVE